VVAGWIGLVGWFMEYLAQLIYSVVQECLGTVVLLLCTFNKFPMSVMSKVLKSFIMFCGSISFMITIILAMDLFDRSSRTVAWGFT
jgi:Na+/pantothenate symporter